MSPDTSLLELFVTQGGKVVHHQECKKHLFDNNLFYGGKANVILGFEMGVLAQLNLPNIYEIMAPEAFIQDSLSFKEGFASK